MTIVSSSQDNIDAVLKKVNNPNLEGKVGNGKSSTGVLAFREYRGTFELVAAVALKYSLQ